jgi:general secretion pathway protein G
MTKDRGFTLLEVLVSATIIAVLTVIGVVSFSSVNKRSRDVKRKSDLEQIRSALEMYRSDNIVSPGQYPSSGAGSYTNATSLAGSLVSTYAPAIPDDPNSSNHYRYRAIDSGGGVYSSYCLCAFLENVPSNPNTCGVALDATCNYGLKSP